MGDRNNLFAFPAAKQCYQVVIRLYETGDDDFLKACTITWNFHVDLNMSLYGVAFIYIYVYIFCSC